MISSGSIQRYWNRRNLEFWKFWNSRFYRHAIKMFHKFLMRSNWLNTYVYTIRLVKFQVFSTRWKIYSGIRTISEKFMTYFKVFVGSVRGNVTSRYLPGAYDSRWLGWSGSNSTCTSQVQLARWKSPKTLMKDGSSNAVLKEMYLNKVNNSWKTFFSSQKSKRQIEYDEYFTWLAQIVIFLQKYFWCPSFEGNGRSASAPACDQFLGSNSSNDRDRL